MYRHRHLKFKIKYHNLNGILGGGNNKINTEFAETLANFMKDNLIGSNDYAIISGYCVGRITGRKATDLDVIVNKEAFNKLKLNKNIQIKLSEISKTESLKLNTDFGEIEFFEREDKGFPSDTYSLDNLKKNKMLDIDEHGNSYLNEASTIQIYSDVKKVDGKLYLGDHKINIDRLKKNISHLELINNYIKSDDIIKKIEELKKLI